MLTIENIDKIVNKTLGKKNFYVESITERILKCPITGVANTPAYMIGITNRKFSVTIELDREVSRGGWGYRLIGISGKHEYLSLKQIQNIDIVLDKIRYVGID
jgi:hypothetical protein